MGVIREPDNIDLIVKSKPWTESELREFREFLKKRKELARKRKLKDTTPKRNSIVHTG